ncbi:MAG: LPS assembly lipoprotein LptE [Gammaproteobacteria bacterium]|nr:LPS assembly lipoprotein LptE [Gammaproteobacteria bacterium]
MTAHRSMRQSNTRRNLLMTLFFGAVTGCGFEFEQKLSFPFSSLYIQTNHQQIKEKLGAYFSKYPSLKVYTHSQDLPLADVVLDVVSLKQSKDITSKSITGRVLEYTLRLKCAFRVVDKNGIEKIPEMELQLEEAFSYDIPLALAKEYEEQKLQDKIFQDLIDKIVLRLLYV